MKNIAIVCLLVVCGLSVRAQKHTLESSRVSFFSDGAIEDISAYNTKAASIFNTETGDVVFSVPIGDFEFEKSLMKEHFNEKYMETEKFPKSTFQGKVTGYQSGATGEQPAKATGKLTIHGVSKDVEIPGMIEFISGKAIMKSKFIVKLVDYKIAIPQLLWQNIAEEIEVKIEFTYKAE